MSSLFFIFAVEKSILTLFGMARKSKIQYDPKKSIEENARLNNVTKDGIYYYLRTNGIERKEDRLDNLIAEITKAIKANPTASQAEIARNTGRSVTTINKYWRICKGEENAPKISRNKFPKTDINRLGISPDIFNEIIAIEDFTPTIAEPYRIDGISGISTIQTNIYNDDFPKSKFDVVTIPSPTNNLPDIILKCLKVSKNKVALLLPIRYLTDQTIYGKVLKKHPLYKLYIMPDSNYAWFVWAKDFNDVSEIIWLTSTESTETAIEPLKASIPTEKPIIITPKPNRIYGIIGAIIGDIAGSKYENKGNTYYPKRKFQLFGKSEHFTDDTVLTIAVADALMHQKPFNKTLWEYGNLYPNAGYGKWFKNWLKDSYKVVNRSGGNGGAMRISSVGFRCDSIEEVLRKAKEATVPTHNSEIGIKGAQAIASAVFMAKKGKQKEEIKQFIENKFGYDLNLSIEDIQRMVANNELGHNLARLSIAFAIIGFLSGNDYEDVIRKAISMGGDPDTIGCMAGAIGAAYYGVPIELAEQATLFLPKDLLDIINEFDGASLINPHIAPNKTNSWSKNTIIVYGCNKEETVWGNGHFETIRSRQTTIPKKGYPIHTIGTTLNSIKREINTLIEHIKADPTSIYVIDDLTVNKKSEHGIEAIAPLFKPLLNMNNVYMAAKLWDYLYNSPA